MSKIPVRLAEKINDLYDALDSERYTDAEELVLRLNKEYPMRIEPVGVLFDYCITTNKFTLFLDRGETALKRYPREDFLYAGMAQAYLQAGFPLLANRMAEKYLSFGKKTEYHESVREVKEILESKLEEIIKDSAMPDAALDTHERLENVRYLYTTTQWDQAIKEAKKLIKQWPDCFPAYNNLSLSYWEKGNLEQAISTTEKALSREHDNIHAIANSIRFRVLNGAGEDEIEQLVQTLLSSEKRAWQKELKILESLAWLGRDRDIVRMVETFYGGPEKSVSVGRLVGRRTGSAKSRIDESAIDDPFIFHFAAAAFLRLGDEKTAESLWTTGLVKYPDFDLMESNLEDFYKREGGRNGPWYFPLSVYLPGAAMDRLEKAIKTKDEESIRNAVRGISSSFPFSMYSVPILLDRGGPLGRFFALLLLEVNDEVFSRYKEELQRFALGRKGDDEMREKAVRLLQWKGLVPGEKVTMWLSGEKRTLETHNYEIIDEPMEKIQNPEAQELHEKGYYAIQEARYREAEEFLRKAHEVAPDTPTILNNLAISLERQGKKEEAYAIIHDIYKKFPDYSFAQIAIAREYIKKGETEKAVKLLEPLLDKKRFHISEYTALCVAQIDRSIKEKQIDAARKWLGMLEEVSPDHPAAEAYALLKNWPF